MRDFKDLSWSEGSEALLALLPRLTVMRGMLDSEPLCELIRCCTALIEGDIRTACDACFSMTGAMLRGGSRRVTGDLFKDYLLQELFLEPHPFAEMASMNRLDEALYNAMKEDMDVLYNIRGLTGETLYRFVQERYEELRRKARPGKDSATRIAEAAWGGGSVKPAQEEPMRPQPNLPAFLPNGAPNWHYGEEELRDSFAADEALEEMYHRFLESDLDWSSMVEDLWNFFAAYGSGVFLKNRYFTYRRGELCPMDDPSPAFSPLIEREYRALLSHAIEFMRGDSIEPLLLVGAEGMGKTTMLFSIPNELPEMRFIYVPECRSLASLEPLFKLLSTQPLKFMVALDDAELNSAAFPIVPANVLLTVSCEKLEDAAGHVFTKRVLLPQLRLDSFSELVSGLLDSEGAVLPRETVRSACIDHQVDSKGELTVAAAVSVARKLSSID